MSTLDQYATPLEHAIDKMRSQMAQPANVAKLHWHTQTFDELTERIDVNLRHLHSAYLADDTERADRCAANIANFAWMIADNVRSDAASR